MTTNAPSFLQFGVESISEAVSDHNYRPKQPSLGGL